MTQPEVCLKDCHPDRHRYPEARREMARVRCTKTQLCRTDGAVKLVKDKVEHRPGNGTSALLGTNQDRALKIYYAEQLILGC